MTFEEAISYTENLLSRFPLDKKLDDTELETEIAELVQTQNGARGFFVAFLTGEWQLADEPSMAVIRALQSAPDAIAELLVKNLAMSTAMAITHQRAGNSEQAAGSARVAKRTALLIEKVDLAEVQITVSQMQTSAMSGRGEYVAFLEKWGYDAEQKEAIAIICQRHLDYFDTYRRELTKNLT